MKDFLKLCWKLSPSYLILLVINAVVASVQLFFNVILPKFLIDELTGEQNVSALIIYAALLISTNLLFSFLASVLKRLLDVRNIRMSEMLEKYLGEKIMTLPYALLEDPYYLDLKERAKFAITNQSAIIKLIEGLINVLRYAVTMLCLIVLMFQLSFVLVLLVLTASALMLVTQKSFSSYQQNFFQQLLPVNRKYGYYVNLAFSDEPQKDIRLFHMAPMLGNEITTYNLSICRWFSAFYKKLGISTGLLKVLGVLQTALSYGYIGLRCITDSFGKRIGIGSLTMYVNASISFGTSFFSFGENFINVRQMLGYLAPFLELISTPSEKETGGTKLLKQPIQEISFEHVSFSYPKSSKKILDDISFTIHAGEKISIVGLNGAGKTTLVKLLCRLYHPDSGTIKLNGTDIFAYDYDSYLKRISAVFQDFKLFNFTIGENVSCEPVRENEEKIQNLFKEVGLSEKISELKNGIHTLLGKEYDESGVDLSGGQKQKIAIARALYKKADFIIMDEPTSALDPLAEAEIYEEFNKMAGNKTAIYISHRMSSSVFCDKILVLDNGKVTDFDTHTALMQKKDSLYYKLFQAQAVNYELT